MWTIYSRIAVFLHFPREIVWEMRNVKSGGAAGAVPPQGGDTAAVRLPLLWRSSALTRQALVCHYMIVNRAPAKCCVWPDIDRQGPPCAREPAAGRGWENPSGFAQPPPLSGEAIRALDGARASHERGGVAAGDGGVKPVPRRLCREKKAQRSLTSQAAPCYNVDMKG